MLWFASASVGLASFLGKILVAVKKLFSSTIFSNFRYRSITLPFFSKDNDYKFFKKCFFFAIFYSKIMFYHLYKNQPRTLFSFANIKG